jgi:hypothetical protein
MRDAAAGAGPPAPCWRDVSAAFSLYARFACGHDAACRTLVGACNRRRHNVALLFGGPVDPGWEPFRQGLAKHFGDLSKPFPRWNAQRRQWLMYQPNEWTLEEVDLPDLDPGDAIDPVFDFAGGGRQRLRVQEFWLDEVFVRVRDTESSARTRYNHLIWNPVSGAWRQATRKAGGGDPSKPPPPPGPCDRQIAEVNRMRDQGLITPAQADAAIRDILKACT